MLHLGVLILKIEMLRLTINKMSKFKILFILFFILINPNLVFSKNIDQAKLFVNDLGNQIIKIASDKNNDVDKTRNNLIDLIDSVVDSKWVSRFVLGKNYRLITVKQKDIFEELYKKYMINSYFPSFQGYNGEKFEVTRALQQNKYFIVDCIFFLKDSSQVNISFRLKEDTKNSFAVLDVIAEGISLIQTQRSEFKAVISNKGIDGLLKDLEDRVKIINLIL